MGALHRYMRDDRGWTMSGADVIEACFPGQDYGTRVPKDVRRDWFMLGGCNVMYAAADEAATIWQNLAPSKRRRGMTMRALAECPTCHRVTAASRINQHARVHDKETV